MVMKFNLQRQRVVVPETDVYSKTMTTSISTTSRVRTVIPASRLTDVDASLVRVSIAGDPGNRSWVHIDSMYIGLKGAGAYDFDGNQVEVKFDGSSGIEKFIDFDGQLLPSDLTVFDYDGLSDIVIAIDHGSSPNSTIGGSLPNTTESVLAGNAASSTLAGATSAFPVDYYAVGLISVKV